MNEGKVQNWRKVGMSEEKKKERKRGEGAKVTKDAEGPGQPNAEKTTGAKEERNKEQGSWTPWLDENLAVLIQDYFIISPKN